MWPYDNQGFGGQQQFGQYQPPQQQQWMQSAQQQIPKAQAAANQQGRMQQRINTLQEQYKGAGSEEQAGMQQRINEMQAKLKEQQGTATGAQRENFGWRQERRQAKNAVAGGGDPAMAPQQGGAQPEPAMMQGRGMPWGGGMGMGGGMYSQMGNQMGGASQYGGGFPQGFGQMQNGFGMNPMQYGGGMYGGGMGGMGEGAFRGGYNPNQQGGGYSGDYQSQVGQYQQRLAQYQQQAAANGGNGGYAGPPAPPMGMYDNNGNLTQGANRPGMQYRQDRRQARQGEAGPGAPNPGATPVSPMQPQQGGWNPAWGTPTDQFGNATTPEAYNQRMKDFQTGGMGGMLSGSMFKTRFGDLVQSSGGNGNVYKVNGQSDNDLYHYDPKINDWKHMTADEYRGYGDYDYFNPLSSTETAKTAGAQTNDYWYNGGGNATATWNPDRNHKFAPDKWDKRRQTGSF